MSYIFLPNPVFSFLLILLGYPSIHLILYYCSNTYHLLQLNPTPETCKSKLYIVKNIIKFLNLLYLTPYAFKSLSLFWLLQPIKWDNMATSLLCYSIPDTVSLLFVKNIRLHTVIHHVAVTLLSISIYLCMQLELFDNEYINYIPERLIFLYGTNSVFTGIVNFYLACRYLIPKTALLHNIKGIAAMVYSCSLVFSGVYIYYFVNIYYDTMINLYYYRLLLTLSFISTILYDDYKLLKHLTTRSVDNGVSFIKRSVE